MSGGDLDGDEFLVVWDPQLLAYAPQLQSVAPADYSTGCVGSTLIHSHDESSESSKASIENDNNPMRMQSRDEEECTYIMKHHSDTNEFVSSSSENSSLSHSHNVAQVHSSGFMTTPPQTDWVSYAAQYEHYALAEIDRTFRVFAAHKGVSSPECTVIAHIFSRAVDRLSSDVQRLRELSAAAQRLSLLPAANGMPVWERMFKIQTDVRDVCENLCAGSDVETNGQMSSDWKRFVEAAGGAIQNPNGSHSETVGPELSETNGSIETGSSDKAGQLRRTSGAIPMHTPIPDKVHTRDSLRAEAEGAIRDICAALEISSDVVVLARAKWSLYDTYSMLLRYSGSEEQSQDINAFVRKSLEAQLTMSVKRLETVADTFGREGVTETDRKHSITIPANGLRVNQSAVMSGEYPAKQEGIKDFDALVDELLRSVLHQSGCGSTTAGTRGDASSGFVEHMDGVRGRRGVCQMQRRLDESGDAHLSETAFDTHMPHQHTALNHSHEDIHAPGDADKDVSTGIYEHDHVVGCNSEPEVNGDANSDRIGCSSSVLLAAKDANPCARVWCRVVQLLQARVCSHGHAFALVRALCAMYNEIDHAWKQLCTDTDERCVSGIKSSRFQPLARTHSSCGLGIYTAPDQGALHKDNDTRTHAQNSDASEDDAHSELSECMQLDARNSGGEQSQAANAIGYVAIDKHLTWDKEHVQHIHCMITKECRRIDPKSSVKRTCLDSVRNVELTQSSSAGEKETHLLPSKLEVQIAPDLNHSAVLEIEAGHNTKKRKIEKTARLTKQAKQSTKPAKPEPLPVMVVRDQVVRLLAEYRAVIITAETGSGKSTQIPQLLADDLAAELSHLARGEPYCKVVCTQPRRVATMEIAKRVQHEYGGTGTAVGGFVGYIVGRPRGQQPQQTAQNNQAADEVSHRMVSDATRVAFVTEGILLRELMQDPYLSKYAVVIIDEAHERGRDTDVILALLRKALCAADCSLRVVVMSASIDSKRFSDYLGGCPVVKCPGRTFAVTNEYVGQMSLYDNDIDLVKQAVDVLFDKIIKDNTAPPGTVLIFLPGSGSITSCVEMIKNRARDLNLLKAIQAVPLYASLSAQEQKIALAPVSIIGNSQVEHKSKLNKKTAGKSKQPLQVRKVVCCTNVAETSLTIDGVRFVIDSGLAKVSSYDAQLRMSTLREESISQASAKQRMGRAGRTNTGTCYQLYTESEYGAMDVFAQPLILRSAIEDLLLFVLHCTSAQNLRALDLLDCPEDEAIEYGTTHLLELGFIKPLLGLKNCYELTTDGQVAATLASDFSPQCVRLILEAQRLGCGQQGIMMAMGIMTGRDVFIGDRDLIAQFDDDVGDWFTFFNVFHLYNEQPARTRKTWALENGVDYRLVHQSFSRVLSNTNRELKRYHLLGTQHKYNQASLHNRLSEAIVRGFFHNIAALHDATYMQAGYTVLCPTTSSVVDCTSPDIAQSYSDTESGSVEKGSMRSIVGDEEENLVLHKATLDKRSMLTQIGDVDQNTYLCFDTLHKAGNGMCFMQSAVRVDVAVVQRFMPEAVLLRIGLERERLALTPLPSAQCSVPTKNYNKATQKHTLNTVTHGCPLFLSSHTFAHVGRKVLYALQEFYPGRNIHPTQSLENETGARVLYCPLEAEVRIYGTICEVQRAAVVLDGLLPQARALVRQNTFKWDRNNSQAYGQAPLPIFILSGGFHVTLQQDTEAELEDHVPHTPNERRLVVLKVPHTHTNQMVAQYIKDTDCHIALDQITVTSSQKSTSPGDLPRTCFVVFSPSADIATVRRINWDITQERSLFNVQGCHVIRDNTVRITVYDYDIFPTLIKWTAKAKRDFPQLEIRKRKSKQNGKFDTLELRDKKKNASGGVESCLDMLFKQGLLHPHTLELELAEDKAVANAEVEFVEQFLRDLLSKRDGNQAKATNGQRSKDAKELRIAFRVREGVHEVLDATSVSFLGKAASRHTLYVDLFGEVSERNRAGLYLEPLLNTALRTRSVQRVEDERWYELRKDQQRILSSHLHAWRNKFKNQNVIEVVQPEAASLRLPMLHVKGSERVVEQIEALLNRVLESPVEDYRLWAELECTSCARQVTDMHQAYKRKAGDLPERVKAVRLGMCGCVLCIACLYRHLLSVGSVAHCPNAAALVDSTTDADSASAEVVTETLAADYERDMGRDVASKSKNAIQNTSGGKKVSDAASPTVSGKHPCEGVVLPDTDCRFNLSPRQFHTLVMHFYGEQLQQQLDLDDQTSGAASDLEVGLMHSFQRVVTCRLPECRLPSIVDESPMNHSLYTCTACRTQFCRVCDCALADQASYYKHKYCRYPSCTCPYHVTKAQRESEEAERRRIEHLAELEAKRGRAEAERKHWLRIADQDAVREQKRNEEAARLRSEELRAQAKERREQEEQKSTTLCTIS